MTAVKKLKMSIYKIVGKFKCYICSAYKESGIINPAVTNSQKKINTVDFSLVKGTVS